jgi:hypothetical protein
LPPLSYNPTVSYLLCRLQSTFSCRSGKVAPAKLIAASIASTPSNATANAGTEETDSPGHGEPICAGGSEGTGVALFLDRHERLRASTAAAPLILLPDPESNGSRFKIVAINAASPSCSRGAGRHRGEAASCQ